MRAVLAASRASAPHLARPSLAAPLRPSGQAPLLAPKKRRAQEEAALLGQAQPVGFLGAARGLCRRRPRIMAAVPPRFDQLASLRTFLDSHGIDAGLYGHGNAKTVEELFEEIEKGETSLEFRGGGGSQQRIVRVVKVLNLFLLSADMERVLVEERQVFPDGRVRERGLVVSEKLVGNEPWSPAVARAVAEELGSALEPGYRCEVRPDSFRLREDTRESPSYPGLSSAYLLHDVEAVAAEGFSAGDSEGRFVTREPRPGGELVNHWRWVPVAERLDLPSKRPQ